jgi:hypothetical protein
MSRGGESASIYSGYAGDILQKRLVFSTRNIFGTDVFSVRYGKSGFALESGHISRAAKFTPGTIRVENFKENTKDASFQYNGSNSVVRDSVNGFAGGGHDTS